MIKQIKKFQIKLTPFDATKEWAMSTTNNQDLLLMDDTASLDEEPVALEFIDYGNITDIEPHLNFECDIALEQQPDDLLNIRTGLKISGLFYPDQDPINQDKTYKRTVFSQVRTMFYNKYHDPTKIWGMEQIDFDLGKTKRKISDEFRLFDFPQQIYGDKIVPNTIIIKDNSLDVDYEITDDGFGNLIAGNNLFSRQQEVSKHDNWYQDGFSDACDAYFNFANEITGSNNQQEEDMPLDQAIYDPTTDKIFGVRGQWVYKLNSSTADKEAEFRFYDSAIGRSEIAILSGSLYCAPTNFEEVKYFDSSFVASPDRDVFKVDTSFSAITTMSLNRELQQSTNRDIYQSWIGLTTVLNKIYAVSWDDGIWSFTSPSDHNRLRSGVPLVQLDYDTTNNMIWATDPLNFNMWVYEVNFSAQGFDNTVKPTGVAYVPLVDAAYGVNGTSTLLRFDGDDASTALRNFSEVFGHTTFTLSSGINPNRCRFCPYTSGNPFQGKLLIPTWKGNSILIWDVTTDTLTDTMTGFNSPVDIVFTPTKAFAVQTSTVGLKEIVYSNPPPVVGPNLLLKLKSSSNPSVFGISSFTASLIALELPVPTGSIQFKINSVNSGNAIPLTMSNVTILETKGNASFYPSLLPGTYTIEAVYSGDFNYSSTSSLITQVINKRNASLNVVVSPNFPVYLQPVTFSLFVNSAFVGAPTGSNGGNVTFVTYGITPLSNGTASLSVNPLSSSVGANSTTCYWVGDSNYLPGTSSLNYTVEPANTTITLSLNSNTSSFGDNIYMTTTVNSVSPSMGKVNESTVEFYVNQFPYSLNRNNNPTLAEFGTLMYASNVVNGTASFTSSAMVDGLYQITASFIPSSNYNGSNSNMVGHLIKTSSILTMSLSKYPDPGLFADTQTFRMGMSGPAGQPTGQVYLAFNGGTLGVGLGFIQTLISGSIDIDFIPENIGTVGVNSFTASYQGDSTYSTLNGYTIPSTFTFLFTVV